MSKLWLIKVIGKNLLCEFGLVRGVCRHLGPKFRFFRLGLKNLWSRPAWFVPRFVDVGFTSFEVFLEFGLFHFAVALHAFSQVITGGDWAAFDALKRYFLYTRRFPKFI